MSKTNKNNGCIEIPERLVALFPCRECQGESQEEDVVSEVADEIAEMGVLLKEFSSLLAAVAVHVGNVADGLIETFADECFSEAPEGKLIIKDGRIPAFELAFLKYDSALLMSLFLNAIFPSVISASVEFPSMSSVFSA